MTKPTKWHVHPSKTQISLGICPVWSVFAVHMKKAWVLSYPLSAQRRLWSDWADLSFPWVHSHFVGFCSWGGSCSFRSWVGQYCWKFVAHLWRLLAYRWDWRVVNMQTSLLTLLNISVSHNFPSLEHSCKVTDLHFRSSYCEADFVIYMYRNFPKFSDRQVWANSADPD